MTFAEPFRTGLDEFGRDERAFDGASYLYLNEDVRDEIGFDVEGAWRHWTSVGHSQGRYPPGVGRTAPRHIDPDEMASRPFGINVFGPFDAISGLGTAARNLVAAIRAGDIPYDLHPYDVETGHARITQPELAAPIRYRINVLLANADQIRTLAGLYPDGTFDSAHTIAVWAWELACFRHDWRASFALVDEVWTNSEFELRSIAAVAPVPVHLMPLPIMPAPEIDRLAARSRFGLPPNAFVFLLAFDAGSTEERKNPWAAIKAFREAFGPDPYRVLVVKHHGASIDLSRRLFAAIGSASNIRAIGTRLDQSEQLDLQAACDALVSPHRSEGFGLNLAEFIASGRAVIGTDYSGCRDFLDQTTGFPISCRLVEVGRRAGPYLQHGVWADIDVAELRQAMRAVVADPQARAARSAAGRARMTGFCPAAIGAYMRELLSKLRVGSGSDGLATTALASLSLFVPPDPARAGVPWPARLPMFSVVAQAAPSNGLASQIYPFWETCFVADDLPPTQDAAARAILRGDDMRVRLLRTVEGVPPAIVAAEAAAGAWLVLLPSNASLAPDALLSVARALDCDAPADAVSLGLVPFEFASPLVVRKSVLLAAWTGGSLEETLAAVAGHGARVAHVAGVVTGLSRAENANRPPGNLVSIRSLVGDQGDDVRRHARMVCRGLSSDSLIIIESDSAVPDHASLGGFFDWTIDRSTGGMALPGLFATRRGVLERIARLADPAQNYPSAVEALGLKVARQNAPMTDDIFVSSRSLAEHAALIRSLGLFDADHYLVSSPDVAASGTDPISHYVEYGWREHRAPNFYFDPVWYRARYMEEHNEIDPLLHYARYRNSGVRPSRHFDPAWVRRSRHLPPGVDPLRYFLERRREDDVSPLPEFDPAWYRARRRDIVYRKVDPFEHYMRFGAAEGVNPSADFDTAFYAARHMSDVGQRDPVANNPLLHYLENRDRQPAITSLKAALRQEIARLRLLGRSFIEMSFCWFDGLPQRIDPLRTLLAEPTLAMPFLLVFANALFVPAAVKAGDERLSTALQLPFTDDYDDADICARLAECFADARCLRREGRPIVAFIRASNGPQVDVFAERMERRLAAEHGVRPVIELFD